MLASLPSTLITTRSVFFSLSPLINWIAREKEGVFFWVGVDSWLNEGS